MQTTIENGFLVIKLPLQTPTPSSTGKTLIVAGSGGPTKSTAVIDGKPVTINCTAWIQAGAKG